MKKLERVKIIIKRLEEIYPETPIPLEHKNNLLKMYNNSWIPERQRLLKQGADIVWYEDIKNIYSDQNIYFGGYKLEPVWSTYDSQR